MGSTYTGDLGLVLAYILCASHTNKNIFAITKSCNHTPALGHSFFSEIKCALVKTVDITERCNVALQISNTFSIEFLARSQYFMHDKVNYLESAILIVP